MDEFYEAYKKAEEIEDPERRAQAIKILKSKEDQLILGLTGIDDQFINVNHNPWVLFKTVITDIYNTLDALITGTLNPRLISGPIGIVASISTQWGVGLKSAFWWMAVISLNLGLINLIPLPVLDGGSICLSFVELITGKKISINTLEKLIIPFIIALLLLLLYFTYNDIISILKIFFGFK